MAFDSSLPVLLVDDYQTMVRVMRHLLNRAGFATIDEASDGEEALARMAERHYGLVISDLHMAPVDGLELVRRAKADEALKSVPIMLVSADELPETVMAAHDAGAAAYLIKPFDAETLRNRIAAVLADEAPRAAA